MQYNGDIMKLIKKTGFKEYGKQNRKYRLAIFECEVCGNIVEVNFDYGKKQKTCGCLFHKDSLKKSKYNWLYSKYRGMIKRCYDENCDAFKNYGGRGIEICNDWKQNYKSFKKWALKNGAKKELEIERVDNDKDYEPTNCKFVTSQENAQNRRSTKLSFDIIAEIKQLVNDGYSIRSVARLYGVAHSTISRALKKETWSNCNE